MKGEMQMLRDKLHTIKRTNEDCRDKIGINKQQDQI